jgi:lipopolysaccharide export system protein LptC
MAGRMSTSSPIDAPPRRRGLLDRSRVVGALRLLLPLTALGLLSMVFLLASPIDPSRAIDQAPIDVQDRARDPRLSAARFAGVTDDGTAIRIEAGAARSDPGATLRFQVQDFGLWLDPSDATAPGDGLSARSDTGQIDRGQGRFQMAGSIRLTADPGYDLTAARIDGLLDRTRIEIAGPVAGTAPAGEIRAGSLLVQAANTESGSYRLVFRDGVRLIYQPVD